MKNCENRRLLGVLSPDPCLKQLGDLLPDLKSPAAGSFTPDPHWPFAFYITFIFCIQVVINLLY